MTVGIEMGSQNQQVGEWGENQAAEYLRKIGYRILEQNYRTILGEIGIVALHQIEETPCLVFVEVKTRTNIRFGYPEDAITSEKWLRILKTIDDYLEQQEMQAFDWRFDVISIHCAPSLDISDLTHFQNVVIENEDDY
jgi:putative endonuclease